jgi:hypothetical protein
MRAADKIAAPTRTAEASILGGNLCHMVQQIQVNSTHKAMTASVDNDFINIYSLFSQLLASPFRTGFCRINGGFLIRILFIGSAFE